MTETPSVRARRWSGSEQSLRGWLDERLADTEEQARLSRFLDELKAPALPPATDAEPEALGREMARTDEVAVWEAARALVAKYAELREQLWRAVGDKSGPLTERLIPLAAHLEQAVDEVLASGLEQELRAYDARIREQAALDALTRLPGRAWLTSRLDEELARGQRYERPFALLFIDLDGLKQINDTYGHEVGDRALAHLAASLRQNIRGTDLVGRYGGDEFICILAETTGEGATPLAERIVQGASSGVPLPPGRLTISVGVAGYPEHGKTIDDLLHVADQGLYQVKAKGGNAFALPTLKGKFTVHSA